jgi:VCBS repeat-containing protein
MNAPIILAQANPSSTAPRVIRLEKPAADAAVTLRLDGVTRLDLGAIAAEQITLVRIGDTLVILFDNKATVTLEPFFAADGTPRDDLAVQLGPDRIVNGDQFAALFPVSDDASVLPAAGDGPSGGGLTTTFRIDGLDGGRNALALLERDLAALTGGSTEEEQVELPVDNDPDILGPADAALTELADTTGAETVHTVTGVLEFFDDATDTGHTAVVTGVAATGETAGLPDDALLAAFMNIDGITPVPGTNGGTIDWRFAAPDRVFDYLAAGETTALAYQVTLTDQKGASDSDTVTVTVTGSNDRPDFDATVDGAVTERTGTTNSEALDETAGTLSFTDVDLNDVGHTAVVTLAAASGNLGNFKGDPATWFSIDGVAKAAGNNTGLVNWSFAAPDLTFDYLAAGQQLFLDYTVELDDGDGGTTTATQRIVVTGANDTPTLFGHVDMLGIIEDNFATNSGSIGFKDPDMPDAHQLSFAPQNNGVRADGGAYIGSFSLGGITGDAALSNAFFFVNYQVSNPELQFLAEGQSLSQYYDVTITDLQGAFVTHTVEIRLQGDNDGPEFGTPVAGSVAEAANTTGSTTPIETSGSLAFTDVDLADIGHTASKTGVARSGTASGLAGVSDETLLSWFSIDGVTKAAGASNGNVAWSFAAADRTFDYLAAGQVLTLDYTVEVDDGDGGTDTVTQTVTVVGANDVPEFRNSVDWIQTTEANADISFDAGNIEIWDPDLIRGHTVLMTPQNGGVRADGGNYIGHLNLGFTTFFDGFYRQNVLFSVSAEDTQFLAAGQVIDQYYDVTVVDAAGGSDTHTIRVTYTGMNDAPELGATSTASLLELFDTTGSNARLEQNGGISFTDVDLADIGHDAVDTTVTRSGVTAGLAADDATLENWFRVTRTDKAAGAATGNVEWFFAAADRNFDYLAANETLILDYTVSLSDGDGGTDTVTQRIEIVGTNDAPTVSNPVIGALIVENGNLDSNLSVRFKDADWSNTHSVTIAPRDATRSDGGGYLGTVALGALSGTASSATGALQDITYQVAAADLDFLALGQEISQFYRVTVTDGIAPASYDVEVKFRGANDAPVFAAPAAVGITEPPTPPNDPFDLLLTGSIAFTDVDRADTGHSATVTGLTLSGVTGALSGSDPNLLAFFTIDNVTKAAGAQAGSVSWFWSPQDSYFDYLADGEKLYLDYTVSLSDGDGGTHTVQQRVEVTGTNDFPTAHRDDVHILGDLNNHTVALPTWALLNNDYDPEGGFIWVTNTSDVNAPLLPVAPPIGPLIGIAAAFNQTGFTYYISDMNPVVAGVAVVHRETGNSNTATIWADTVISGDASDTLNGGLANDILLAGNGNDLLVGGQGRDVLRGDGGADRFRYDSAGDGGTTSGEADRILDFNGADGDTIEILLSGAGFAGAGLPAAGSDATSIFGAGQKFNFDAGTLWYDGDGAGGAAAVALAVLENGGTVDATQIRFV